MSQGPESRGDTSSSEEARRSEGPARSPLLELRGITKRFGAVQAMTDVSLKVYPAEVIALVGDNGEDRTRKVMLGAPGQLNHRPSA